MIKLTLVGTQKPIWIQKDRIAFIHDSEHGAIIAFGGLPDDSIQVNESAEVIGAMWHRI